MSADLIAAIDQDDARLWVRRENGTVTRNQAQHVARDYMGYAHTPLRTFYVTAKHMRPHDCKVDCRENDAEDDEPYTCALEEEGWQHVCEPDHPQAYPVWQVDATEAL